MPNRFGQPVCSCCQSAGCTQCTPKDPPAKQFSRGGMLTDTESDPNMLRLRISALQLVAKTQDDRIVELEARIEDLTREINLRGGIIRDQRSHLAELEAESVRLVADWLAIDTQRDEQITNQRLQIDGLHRHIGDHEKCHNRIVELESRLKDREAVADTNTRYWAGEHSRLESIINGFVDGDELAQAKERIEGLEAKNQELVNAVEERYVRLNNAPNGMAWAKLPHVGTDMAHWDALQRRLNGSE